MIDANTTGYLDFLYAFMFLGLICPGIHLSHVVDDNDQAPERLTSILSLLHAFKNSKLQKLRDESDSAWYLVRFLDICCCSSHAEARTGKSPNQRRSPQVDNEQR